MRAGKTVFNKEKIRAIENKIAIKACRFLAFILYYLPFASKEILSAKGFYKNTKDYSKNCEILELYEVNEITRQEPKTIYSEIHKNFAKETQKEFESEYVADIKNVRIVGRDGILLTPENKSILDVNFWAGKLN